MSQFTYQVLKDTNRISVIKLTGYFTDNFPENNVSRIAANTLSGALDANNALLVSGGVAKSFYGTSVYRVWFDVNSPLPGHVRLFWNGQNTGTILTVSGSGEYNGVNNWVPINNNASGNVSGDIGVTTIGFTANSSYSIVMELHKDSQYYNAGQLTEPSAFNYGQFGIKP